MSTGFSGQVAAFYARHRRGYPTEVIDALVDALDLHAEDVVLDLGCGTGQLTLPLAARVSAVIGMDPEPDMLAQARAAARARGVDNISWLPGTDSDLAQYPSDLTQHHSVQAQHHSVQAQHHSVQAQHHSVPAQYPSDLAQHPTIPSLAAMTIAVAVHWMDRDALFPAARRLLRPGGGIAIVTNGTPLWLQDAPWSRDLRTVLECWTGRPQSGTCQTDGSGRRLNADALERAGFRVAEAAVSYDAPLAVEDVIGGVFSAMSDDRLPSAASRREFGARVHAALAPHGPLTEHVTVWIQTGR